MARFIDRTRPQADAERNNAISRLAELLRRDCVVQFETIPFHSSDLRQKERLPSFNRAVPILSSYAQALSSAMREVSVIALSAVASNAPVSPDADRRSPWLSWQAKLMGLDVDKLSMTPLVGKNGRATSGLVYERRGTRAAGFVLTMGGNTFPAERGLRRIAETLAVA